MVPWAPLAQSLSGPETAFLSAAALGAALLVVLLIRSWIAKRRRRAASTQLDAYKEQVVAYSDAMDRLQERHKLLPFTDEDFSAPMVGETLAAYQEVEAALNRHREHWLKLMDIWDQAQQLLEQRQPLQVQKLLASADVAEATAQLQQQCQAELDRLEQAHERVEAMLEAMGQNLQRLQERLAELEALELPRDSWEAELDAVEARREEGQRLLTADPLSAELELIQGTQSLDALTERLEAVLAERQRADEVLRRHGEVTALTAELRAGGLKLREPEGDPDRRLDEAARFHNSAMNVLPHGDARAARQHLDRADSLLDDAAEAIEFQRQFRAEAQTRIDELAKRIRQLDLDADTAGRQRDQLRQRHAESAWRLAGAAAEQAQELAAALKQLIDEAAAQAAPDLQHYYRAQELLAEVRHQLPEAQRLVQAVGEKLEELDRLAGQGRRRLDVLEGERQRLQQLMRSSTADRARSHHRLQQAEAALDRAAADAAQAAPDWPHIARALEHVEKDFQAVDSMVQEDLRLSQQAVAEIREATQEVRRCQSFYQMGVSASVGRAEGEVRAAERALEMQEYERAIELANSAEQLAREAVEAARQEAERREREANARRNREAAMQMASVLATTVAQAAIVAGTRSRSRRRTLRHR